MKVICAWCKKDLGEKEGPEGKVSHGMCKDCHRESLDQLKAMKKKPCAWCGNKFTPNPEAKLPSTLCEICKKQQTAEASYHETKLRKISETEHLNLLRENSRDEWERLKVLH